MPASDAVDKIQARLKVASDNGTGFLWSPSKSKVIEFLAWVYEQLCARGKLEIGDVMAFSPATAPQGRRKFKPTLHQFSVATKILFDEIQREPTHDEVMLFIKRNPDVGVNFFKARLEAEDTARRALARGPLPVAKIDNRKRDDEVEKSTDTVTT